MGKGIWKMFLLQGSSSCSFMFLCLFLKSCVWFMNDGIYASATGFQCMENIYSECKKIMLPLQNTKKKKCTCFSYAPNPSPLPPSPHLQSTQSWGGNSLWDWKTSAVILISGSDDDNWKSWSIWGCNWKKRVVQQISLLLNMREANK